jgi:hypothetical protein
MAALRQKTHILAYWRYASDVHFFRALPSRFLNGPRKRFFTHLKGRCHETAKKGGA